MKVGADPEVFLKSKTTGKFVSAYGKFPGTKADPFRIPGGAIQVDGNALEFNIDPAETEDEFVNNVYNVFNQVKTMVAEFDPDLEVSLSPIAIFDAQEFAALPEEAKLLGCEPDFEAVTEFGEPIESPEIMFDPIRTSSFHIHLGFEDRDVDEFDDEEFVKRLRVAQVVSPKIMEVAKQWETPESEERRKFYGHIFAFRPKPYGVELRCLDGLCLEDEGRLRQLYQTVTQAFSEVEYAM